MQKLFFRLSLLVLVIYFPIFVNGQSNLQKLASIKQTQLFIDEIIRNSYPEINVEKIKIKTFESDTNYFKTRFSYTRFLTFKKMRHLVYVNPKVFQLNVSENGIRAILAHELAHILYYTKKNRLELLGLVRLSSRSFTTKFERRADLEAIKRGYGEGLMEYRRWLYQNIPQEEVENKQKDYFSPEEIELIVKITKQKPEMFEVWQKKIPRNINEIKTSVGK